MPSPLDSFVIFESMQFYNILNKACQVKQVSRVNPFYDPHPQKHDLDTLSVEGTWVGLGCWSKIIIHTMRVLCLRLTSYARFGSFVSATRVHFQHFLSQISDIDFVSFDDNSLCISIIFLKFARNKIYIVFGKHASLLSRKNTLAHSDAC